MKHDYAIAVLEAELQILRTNWLIQQNEITRLNDDLDLKAERIREVTRVIELLHKKDSGTA